MATIKITCDTCHKTHEVTRTNEIPDHVVSMGCNWCPECEDRAEDYYEEWYNENDGDNGNGDDVPDNQLVMPFILDDVPNVLPQPDVIKSVCDTEMIGVNDARTALQVMKIIHERDSQTVL